MDFLYVLFLISVSGLFAMHQDIDLPKLIAGVFFLALTQQGTDDEDASTPLEPPKAVPYHDKYMETFLSMENMEISDERKKQLVHCFILEHTPVGNVMLRYKAENNAFVYYADHIIPYRFLEAVARKYAITYHCRSLVAETKMVKHEPEGKKDDGMKEEPKEEQKEEGEGAKEESDVNIKETEKKEPEKKSVFAKFKSYNKSSMIRSSGGRGAEDAVIPEKQDDASRAKQEAEEKSDEPMSNRYTSEGRMADLQLLQKPKKEALNKRLKMSFADFKKMTMHSKVPALIQVSLADAT